ncbi:MAG: integral rane sensor hybrid histidine kinase [Rariglobus sp.]|nr:integral rane sensor hybrid histidine kinase [Rariglobus sp.]
MSFFAFQPTVLALPQAVAVLLTVVFSVLVWRHRNDRAASRELFLAQCFSVVWSLMGALEFCAGTLEAKIFLSQLSYIGIVGAPWAGFRFAYAYTGVQTPLPRWFMPVSLTWAGLILLAVFTNNYHGLVWTEVVPIEIRGDFFARYDRGPVFWLNIIYGYGLTFATCVLFLRHALDLGGIYRRQSIVTALAVASPWITSLAYVLRVGPLPEIDNTPVGFAAGNLLFTWNLLRWGFLDLTPVATRTLFERMADPVLVIDTRQRLSQANRAATESFQLKPGSVGAPVSKSLAAHPAILAACLDPAGPAPAAQAIPDDDGRWWNIEFTTLASRRGLRYGRLCVLHDITALVEARKAAERAHHAKAEFLAHVSHDLRTPLHSILVLSEILQAGELSAGQRTQLGTLHEAGRSLLRLVNNLLDMNRIESGQIDLADTRFHLDDVLLPVVELLRVPARLKGLELQHETAPGFTGALRGDPDRLRQILFNLAGNAVKCTGRGRVLIRASQPAAGYVRIDVFDTGPGLPPGQEAALFEPFVRGSTDRKKEGTGLGLSIVRRLAEAMGGTASAANGPQGGSVFTVELPIIDEAAAPPPAAVAAPAPATRLSADRHVLLVDDDPRSLATSTALLVHCGCAVATAASGEEALLRLETECYDLVVMDGQMPGLDGVEATRRIRAFPSGHLNAGISVLGLTADSSTLRRDAWLAAGAGLVLDKPSSVAEINAALARIALR